MSRVLRITAYAQQESALECSYLFTAQNTGDPKSIHIVTVADS